MEDRFDMEGLKLKKYLEGLIIIGIGVFFTVLALLVPNNPVVLEGWINTFAQAKMVPLITGIFIIICGLKYTLDLKTEKIKLTYASIADKKFALIVFCLILVYLISLIFFGFKIPTAVFLIMILFYLNKNKSKPFIITSIIVLFYIVSIFLIPLMLRLRLP
jgi:hypothetical protein